MAKSEEESKMGSATGAAEPKAAAGGTSSTEANETPGSMKSAQSTGGDRAQTAAKDAVQTRATGSQQSGTAAKRSADDSDAIALLKQDHRKVEALFAEFEKADERRKSEIVEEACRELIVHTLLEERIFYPASRQPSTDGMLDEAQVEHDAAKVLIVELLRGEASDPFRDAKFKVLAEEIKQHVKEEEAPDGLFAKAQKAGVDTRELAERIADLKRQLQQRAASGRLPDPTPASFTYFGEPSQQERNMPRERDENGRFMSEDDDRGYRSRGRDYDDDRNGSRGRGSTGRERDSEGRFVSDDDDRGGRSYSSRSGGGRSHGGWFGDSEGHSEASRRGWDERESGSRGRSYRDDEDDRGYRSRGRDDEDDRGSRSRGRDDEDDRGSRSRGRGQGGWFGDSEGHSEASRRGWENSDHGRSGWYGDSRGHAEASRRGWENPNHGESGWYGDPQGHSEASRRGWEERGGGRGESSGRGEQRSYARGRDDDDDDDRGGRRSSRGGRDSHGGWSGDPEGHSEASRRGWENRR